MRFKMDFSKLSKCGAKPKKNSTRNHPCRHIALKNGRCYYHNGRPIEHGRYAQKAKEERINRRLMINETKQLLNKMRKSINE